MRTAMINIDRKAGEVVNQVLHACLDVGATILTETEARRVAEKFRSQGIPMVWEVGLDCLDEDKAGQFVIWLERDGQHSTYTG